MHPRLHTMDRVRPLEGSFEGPPSEGAEKMTPAEKLKKDGAVKPPKHRQRKPISESVLLLAASTLWMLCLGIMACMGQDGPLSSTRPVMECAAEQPNMFVWYSLVTMGCAWVLDTLFVLLYPAICRVSADPQGPSPSTRWFFVHFLTNGVISYYAWSDVYMCFRRSCECGTTKWSGGTETVGVALGLHFYHIVFYNLTAGDWLHHGMTALLTTPPILLFQQNRAISLALFFMTGLPGGIDYLLLTLVKLGWIGNMVEKKLYVVLSVWVRGPGVLSAVFLACNTVLDSDISSQLTWPTLLGQCWNMLVCYWNAMYFMHSTLSDFYRPGRHRVAS